MGCDIHAFIEYRRSADRWWPFGSEFRLGRDYDLFGCLAGVRSGKHNPVASGRGVPSDVAYAADSENKLWISDSLEEGCTTKENADHWISSGNSTPIMRDGKMVAVTHPDWHSHSWCTMDELTTVLETVSAEHAPSPDYYAVLAAMKQLEEMGHEARLVFWFDN